LLLGENIAVASDGAILVDSLTGRSATLVTADGTVIETSTLHEDAIADPDTTSSFQVRRLQMVNDRFAGVGSTINEPAQFMAPSTLANATFHMKPVELQPSNEDGELLDLHVWGPQKMITAGWNQTTNAARSPLIFRIDGADPTDAGNWTRVDVFAQGIEYDGGVYALATRGDEVIAVGTKFPTSSGGFVIHSTDAGQTWTDITPGPDKPGEISNAWIFEDGSVYVAGGGLEAYKMSGN